MALASQGGDGSSLPIGTILPYAGPLNKIPDGWALCNGSNGTPDLRNRFLTGAGSSYALGATGGENSHTLTISEIPSHNHPFSSTNFTVVSGSNLPAFPHGLKDMNYFQNNATPCTFLNMNALSTGYKGSNQPHENRPPFYAVYYIIKLA